MDGLEALSKHLALNPGAIQPIHAAVTQARYLRIGTQWAGPWAGHERIKVRVVDLRNDAQTVWVYVTAEKITGRVPLMTFLHRYEVCREG